MSRARVWGSLVVIVLVLGSTAVVSGQPLTRIRRGTFELGTDQMLMLAYIETSTDADHGSELRTTWSGGLTPRYFVLDNFALAARLNAFYSGSRTHTEYTISPLPPASSTSTTWAAGFLGLVLVNYYAHVGPGLFFKPGLGLGGFGGRFEEPVNNTEVRADLGGGAVLFDLGLAWYPSRHFTLRGGFELLVRFGRLDFTTAGVADRDLTAVDFGLGFGGAWSR